jgi:hypothetical protein
MPRRLTTVILFVAALAFAPTPVRAETILCTRIVALPATITVSGSFCLSGNLSTVRDNLTSGVKTPFTGGTDAGNNN